ncbi:MAG: methyltransferase domain-containing protein [Gammaproteobacteria bacterium]|jgi:spermidine synthase
MNMEAPAENFKIRTAYNDLHVCHRQGLLELRSRGNALQSVIDLQAPERLCLKNLQHLMFALLFIPEPERILVLGTAAGSLLHYLRHHLPDARITAVDIDAELVERMLQLQVLPCADERLEYVHADAASYIAATRQSFDLVLVDVFNGARSPSWLLQREISEALHRLCSERGAVSYNLLLASEHDFKSFYRSLGRIYRDNTLYLPVQGYENRIVCAVRQQQSRTGMNERLRQAAPLSSSLGIDFMQLLSVAYNSNPTGIGLL